MRDSIRHIVRLAPPSLLVVCAAVTIPSLVRASGEAAMNPKSVGRAGTDLVSGDNGTTARRNPAGLARRDEWRIVGGVMALTPRLRLRVANAPDAPAIALDAKPRFAAMIAAAGSVGPLVWGASYQQTEKVSHALPAPSAIDTTANIAQQFPHRYGGTDARFLEHSLTLAVSTRLTDTLAVGASIGVAHRSLRERRSLWTGDLAQDPLLDPSQDRQLTTSGTDRWTPTATIGTLLAPHSWPLEFALSGSYTTKTHLRGQAELSTLGNDTFDPQLVARSEQVLPGLWQVRTGIRYLQSRFGLELNVEWRKHDFTRAPSWDTSGLTLDNARDETVAISAVDGLYFANDNVTVATALEYQVVRDFLWAAAGYRWLYNAASASRHNPGFAPVRGHGVSAGFEATIERTTVSAGVLYTLESNTTVPDDGTSRRVLAPFRPVDVPAAAGRYRRSHTTLALSVESAF